MIAARLSVGSFAMQRRELLGVLSFRAVTSCRHANLDNLRLRKGKLMSVIETDILIVGGGAVGSALACALRHANYRVTLVEQRKGKPDTARGDHFQPYTVELLARWGVLQK